MGSSNIVFSSFSFRKGTNVRLFEIAEYSLNFARAVPGSSVSLRRRVAVLE